MISYKYNMTTTVATRTRKRAPAKVEASSAPAPTPAKGGGTLSGVVVSTKMRDTIVVAVTRFVQHPKYRKFMRMTKRYHVHDPGNTAKEGETVQIAACRPISKTKAFRLVRP